MRSPKDIKIIMIDIINACGYSGKGVTRLFGSRKRLFFMDPASGVNGESGAA